MPAPGAQPCSRRTVLLITQIRGLPAGMRDHFCHNFLERRVTVCQLLSNQLTMSNRDLFHGPYEELKSCRKLMRKPSMALIAHKEPM